MSFWLITVLPVDRSSTRKNGLQCLYQPRADVAHCQVFDPKQGKDGLGLEAQRAAVARYIEHQPGQLLAHRFWTIGVQAVELLSGLSRKCAW